MQLVSRASTESRWTEVIDGSRSDSLRELAMCVRPQCYACIRSYLTDMAITHCISLGYDYHSSHVGVSLYRGPRRMLTGPFPYSYGEVTRIRYSVSSKSIPPDLSTTSDRTSWTLYRSRLSMCIAYSFVRQVIYRIIIFFGWHKFCQVV